MEHGPLGPARSLILFSTRAVQPLAIQGFPGPSACYLPDPDNLLAQNKKRAWGRRDGIGGPAEK